MEGADRIRTAFERNAEAMRLRDSIGRGTARTVVRVTDGVRCEIEDGPWKLVADMAAKAGGTDTGPNPGVLGRAGLGSCIAMTYAMWAARAGLELDSLEVEVQTDYDARSYHGVGGVPPGYAQVRYIVTVGTDAPEDRVRAVLDEADAHVDWVGVFREPQDVRRELRVLAPRR